MGLPEKTEARYTNGAGDDTKVTFISGNQKYTTDQEKGNLPSQLSQLYLDLGLLLKVVKKSLHHSKNIKVRFFLNR